MSAMPAEYPEIASVPDEPPRPEWWTQKHEDDVAAARREIMRKDLASLSSLAPMLLHTLQDDHGLIAQERKAGNPTAKIERRIDKNQRKLALVEVQMAKLGAGPIAETLKQTGLKYAEPTQEEIDTSWPDEPYLTDVKSDVVASGIIEKESAPASERRRLRKESGFRSQAERRRAADPEMEAEQKKKEELLRAVREAASNAAPIRTLSEEASAAEAPDTAELLWNPTDEELDQLPERLRRRFRLEPGERGDEIMDRIAKHQEERVQALAELRARKAKRPAPMAVPRPTKKTGPLPEPGTPPVKPVTEKSPESGLRKKKIEVPPAPEAAPVSPEKTEPEDEKTPPADVDLSPKVEPSEPLASTKKDVDDSGLTLEQRRQKWYARLLEIAEDPKREEERKELNEKITKAELLMDKERGEQAEARLAAEAAQIKREIDELQARFDAAAEEARVERDRHFQQLREIEDLEEQRRELVAKSAKAGPDTAGDLVRKAGTIDNQLVDLGMAVDKHQQAVITLERAAGAIHDEKDAAASHYRAVTEQWDGLGLTLAGLALGLEGLKHVSVEEKKSLEKKKLTSEEEAELVAMKKGGPSEFRKDFGDLARRTGRIGKTGFKWVGLGALMVSWGLTRPFRVIGAVLGHLYKATMNPEKFAKEVKERFSKGIKEHGPIGGSLRGAKWMFFGDGAPKKKEKASASSSHD